MSHQTNMRREILEISGAVETLLTRGQDAINSVASALADRNPAFMMSVARGSSDHAATYFKYASELVSGLPVASVGPSITSIYGRTLKLSGSACIAISQSGKSPDIVSVTEMATQQGALTFAVTNNPESDLAKVSSHTLNLHAGAELSVAATKTFVASIVSVAWLLAKWKNDDDLLAAIHRLPTVLERAALLDWSEFIVAMALRQSIYCLGRGITLAISNEAALKLKETCQLHAESYSSAEVLHGPVAIIDRGFPVLAFGAADQAEQAMAEVADQLAALGAVVFATSDKVVSASRLPTARTGHAITDPISLIVSFYALVEQIAVSRNINPDEPRHLRKVTETL